MTQNIVTFESITKCITLSIMTPSIATVSTMTPRIIALKKTTLSILTLKIITHSQYNSNSVIRMSQISPFSGLYYKPLMIVNDDFRVANKLETSLTEDARVFI
jgi:hypothetical protein